MVLSSPVLSAILKAFATERVYSVNKAWASSFIRPHSSLYLRRFSRDKFYQALPFPFHFSFACGESLGTRLPCSLRVTIPVQWDAQPIAELVAMWGAVSASISGEYESYPLLLIPYSKFYRVWPVILLQAKGRRRSMLLGWTRPQLAWMS